MRHGHTNRKRTQFKAFAEARAAYAADKKELLNAWLTKELASEASDQAENLEEYEMICNQFNMVDPESTWFQALQQVANA